MNEEPEDKWVLNEPFAIGAYEAKTHLPRLLRQAQGGKRFVITQRGQPVAELRPLSPALSGAGKRGDLKGSIWMADDFCEPLEEMKDYM
ncbi:MAG: type II toxin-antitoxin system Phd/YefM family antitoxin [Verrucomicrobiota bacterium]